MIVKTDNSQIELIGDIKEFKTGIDPKNLELITTLLSSNLYSAPERSFIREIVSNAWDSHVEAGTTDVPVLIKIGNDFITIRDFGTGMSEERFRDVYCNIGSSTKRGSNDYIGGFGIGKFSSLAVSDTVSIISYYNGKAYHYMMVKDGNNITNNLITVLDTEEKNGVEITVNNLKNMDKYYEALDYIVFFPNIFVDSVKKSYINDVKIKRFDKFSCATTTAHFKILLGNVLYPLDKHIFESYSDEYKFITQIGGTGIVINFNIGELEVTPNRENIIYSEDTINLIKKRVLEAREGLYNYIKSHVKTDYDNIEDWVFNYDSYNSFNFFVNSDVSGYFGYNFFYYNKDIGLFPKFKGKEYSNSEVSDIRNVFNSTVLNTRALVYDDRFYNTYGKLPNKLSFKRTYRYSNVLRLSDEGRMSVYVKDFLKENYDDYLIIKSFTFEEFYNATKGTYGSTENYKELLKEVYDLFMSRVKVLDLKNDKDFLAFKESFKPEIVKLNSKVFRLYIYSSDKYSDIRMRDLQFKTFGEVVSYIKKLKRTVVLSNISDAKPNIICPLGYIQITAAIPIIKALKSVEFKNTKDQDWVLNYDRNLIKLASIVKYKSDNTNLGYLGDIIPENEAGKYKSMVAYYNKYKGFDSLITYAKFIDVPADSCLKSLNDKIEYYRDKMYSICTLTSLNPIYRIDSIILTAIIFKTKAFRINYKTYKSIKNNPILKILWLKSLKQESK